MIKIKRYIRLFSHMARIFILRDKIILSSNTMKTQKGEVNLHWWSKGDNDYNIGDYLSVVVFDWVKKRKGIVDNSSKSGKTLHLYGIGSIIGSGYQNATIWGSGIIREQKNLYWWRKFRKLDIRCVRGPLTRDKLIKNGYDCPKKYGDPAILMPLIYQPEVDKKEDYIIVAHYSHSLNYDNVISTTTNDYEHFIDTIASAKLVISTSLHGIILAEAYSVPAIWVRKENIDPFKVIDYYEGTGRKNVTYANSIEEAFAMTPPPLPELSALQKELIETFPVDLWK